MSSPSLVTLRDLSRARMFPQELTGGKTPARRETCPQCAAPTSAVVITTGGPHADQAVWEAYPIAIDAWRCERCEAMGFPIALSPEEITLLGNDGAELAQVGRLDEAELSLRRVIASWPGYSPPRVNLGALYLDRIRAERAGPNRPAVIAQLATECEHQLRRARANEPAAPPEAAFMLARLLAAQGRTDEARTLFADVTVAANASAALKADATKRILDLGDSPAPARTRKKRVMPWHILALMFGAFGLFFSRGIATSGTFAIAFPIISALLVAWFVSRLLPLWAAAIIPAVVAILAIVNARNVAASERADNEATFLNYALADVCQGKPLNRDPSGRARVRIFDARDTPANFWHDWGGPKGEVPPYVLCIKHHSEDVSCGDYVDDKRPDRGTSRICTSRDIATVKLHRAKTAEVVTSKTYRGGDPPPLTGYVQFGGAGSTRLSGDEVSYETIHADFKSYFE